MLAGPNLPQGEPASCKLTPLGLALSPLIARLGRGSSRAGLSLALQEVGAKLLLEPGTARRSGVLPVAGSILTLPAHQPVSRIEPRPTLFISCPYSGLPVQARLTAQCLQALSRYGRVRPRAARQPFRPALSGSLSRRSSVVEHVIGNDGVSSSILLGGTILRHGSAAQRRAAISPVSRRKPSASATRPASRATAWAGLTL